jgi:uncharacterized membrane protein
LEVVLLQAAIQSAPVNAQKPGVRVCVGGLGGEAVGVAVVSIAIAVSIAVATIAITEHGWPLIAVGCFIGLGFAAVAPAISVVSLRLLLERDAGALIAAATSSRRYRRTRIPMALWSLIVAAALCASSWVSPSLHRFSATLPSISIAK